jgi:hypothetical protein
MPWSDRGSKGRTGIQGFLRPTPSHSLTHVGTGPRGHPFGKGEEFGSISSGTEGLVRATPHASGLRIAGRCGDSQHLFLEGAKACKGAELGQDENVAWVQV